MSQKSYPKVFISGVQHTGRERCDKGLEGKVLSSKPLLGLPHCYQISNTDALLTLSSWNSSVDTIDPITDYQFNL